jgi:hypothetical protein
MEPEDEAFEELALKQGHWQHTSGWRKKQIMETSMTQDEIIEMARQAGASPDGKLWLMYAEELESFTKLVAEKATAKEREACAKLCESLPMQQEIDVRDQCAAAIRARGEQA